MKRLKVRDLHLSYKTYSKTIYAVRGVNFDLSDGEVLGIVGESGCGKSATAKAIMRLLPAQTASIDDGQIIFEETDLLRLPEKQMRRIRGNDISMIFQDPLSSLNPTMRIGDQIAESIKLHAPKITKIELENRVLSLLEKAGISDRKTRIKQYPHELSGGQRQRVMIAIALACHPKLLIADEPTTALDVTIQAQILMQLKSLKNHMSIILITHDLSIVAGVCDRVLVMYAGEIVEEASCEELFKNPKHPYTQRLLNSIPRPDLHKQKRLKAIKGSPPALSKIKNHCSFCPRCKNAMNICALQPPPVFEITNDHHTACWLYDERIKHGTDQDKQAETVLSAQK